MDFSIEEKLSVILIKEYKLNSYIKGYHGYIMKWNATLGEFLKVQLESENEFHSCSQKKRCCRWTFTERKNWSIN